MPSNWPTTRREIVAAVHLHWNARALPAPFVPVELLDAEAESVWRLGGREALEAWLAERDTGVTCPECDGTEIVSKRFGDELRGAGLSFTGLAMCAFCQCGIAWPYLTHKSLETALPHRTPVHPRYLEQLRAGQRGLHLEGMTARRTPPRPAP